MDKKEILAAAIIGGVALMLFSKDGPLAGGFSLGGDNPPATVLSGIVGPGGGNSGGSSGGSSGGGSSYISPGGTIENTILSKKAENSLNSFQISQKILDDMYASTQPKPTQYAAATVPQLVKTPGGFGYVNTPISPIMLNLAGNNPANVPSLARGIMQMTPNSMTLDQVAATITKKQLAALPSTPQSTINNFMSKVSIPMGGGSVINTPTTKKSVSTAQAIADFKAQAPATPQSTITNFMNKVSIPIGGGLVSSGTGTVTKKAASSSSSSSKNIGAASSSNTGGWGVTYVGTNSSGGRVYK